LETLKKLARSESNSKIAQRIQIIVLAMQGYTAPGIALSLSLSRRTCQEWVNRFNQQGFVGLEDQPGRGRNALLTPEECEAFKKRLDAGPTDADGVCTFQGEDLRGILENEFGKVRSLGTVYYLLHQLGYESLVPRPQHRNADEQAQQDFKKSSLKRSKP
jgi:transposase